MLGQRPVIFASVGSMLPFDRFVRAVDEWAAAHPETPVFLQIGAGAYEPQHAEWARIVPHADYAKRLRECDLFVAHVGMGSILQALEARKQMLLMVRDRGRGEHTTDHQLHTARRFADTPGLRITEDETELKQLIGELLAHPLPSGDALPSAAPAAFIDRISGFLAPARQH
jgi:UDP-N-acetylglucosamine transferase subunit ALG13